MAKVEMYVAKYRISDGAVVDIWKGPKLVHCHDANGAVYSGVKKGIGFYAKKLAFLKPKPSLVPKMVHPAEMLVTKGQLAVEISYAQFENLGTLTEANGRLRWKVVEGKLVPNEGLLFTSDKPIVDAPRVNTGVLHPIQIGDMEISK